MIRLRNINKNNNSICCEAYLEDCKERLNLVFNIKNNEFNSFDYPEGYEYCTSHIAKAKYYFIKCIEDNVVIPKEKDIMWY